MDKQSNGLWTAAFVRAHGNIALGFSDERWPPDARTASVKKHRFDDMSLDQLWRLHDDLTRILTRRCERQKQLVEQQLAELGRRFGGSPKELPKARPYPPVAPKYRNPGLSSETWSGRGRQPHWVIEWLDSGGSLEDCRIQ